jgi:FkbM family methyltransferase
METTTQSRFLLVLARVQGFLRRTKGRMYGYGQLAELLGVVGTIVHRLQQSRLRHFAVRRPYTLRSKYARFRLLCRPNTSDYDVFFQVFLELEYKCLDSVREPELIVDCGANAGYSAAYFLTQFPRAKLIAVEPDPNNCAILEANLAPFRGRVRVVRSAIWPRETGLVWEENPFRDGREWAHLVRPVRPGEVPLITATTISSLLKESGAKRISILKIDIEKSELALFSAGYRDWLDRVDNLIIELHDEECASVFHRAISGQGFTVSRCNELTVCRRVAEG